MSHFIIRVDDDLYCIWSNVVDAPVATGTRNEIWQQALSDAVVEAGTRIAAQLDRADATGSSLYGPLRGPLVVESRGTLPLDRLGDWLRTKDDSLLEPFGA